MIRLKVSRPMNTMTFADGAWEGRSRSEEEVMQGHRQQRATQRSPATPISPKGGGGTASISLSLLLHDVITSRCRRFANSTPSPSPQTSWYSWDETLLSVHDIKGGLSNPRVVVFDVAGQYFGYSRIGYLRQSESGGGTDQRTPFFEEREKTWRG